MEKARADDRDIGRTVEVIEAGMAAGLHIGAQVFVARRGETVADFALGEARPGVPMTPDTLMLWLSSTKPIAAVAIGQLWERGALDLDDTAARHVPEFGANGKQTVTLRHLLTHTGGFRNAVPGWSLTPWDETIARICAAPLEPNWTPGEKAGYHAASSWYVLGEVIRRLAGQPFEDYVRAAIFEPLGMQDSWLAFAPERFRAYGARIGVLQNTNAARALPYTWDSETQAAYCRPGASGRGPIRELARFYEMLRGRGTLGGARILSPQTVEALTARHRVGLYDHTFQHVVDWGLGFIPDSKQYGVETVPYGYGPHASRRTFGHSGMQSSVGFCDPAHDLVVTMVFNGTPGEARHNRRIRTTLAALYEDLGLAGETAGEVNDAA